MFFYTLKLPSRRFLAGAVAALCLVAAGVGLPPAEVKTVAAGAVLSTEDLRTNGDRVALMRGLGLVLSEEKPLQSETLLLPRVLPESDYLALQREQGFDLTALSGQRVKRYVYGLESAPELRAELLIFRRKLVGGSLYSTAPEGGMEPLLSAD